MRNTRGQYLPHYIHMFFLKYTGQPDYASQVINVPNAGPSAPMVSYPKNTAKNGFTCVNIINSYQCSEHSLSKSSMQTLKKDIRIFCADRHKRALVAPLG